MTNSTDRRDFLKQLVTSGAAMAVTPWSKGISFLQSPSPARAVLNPGRTRSTLDRNIFGSFLEHLGRAIYDGIYDPGSKLSDAHGYRKDVAALITEMGVPLIRYPGGNFVSGYHWLDGVGPKDQRPTVLDKAWNELDNNQFGTNEFMVWCQMVGTKPLMGFNLGTATPEDAAALVEYCNIPKGTKWSDLRRQHGYEQPWNVKDWCLGNEMDGPWQMGHMTAKEYGEKARDSANQIRRVDPTTNLIACGSSNTILPTYLVWDREVLEQCYDLVDGISLHNYYGNTQELTGNSSARFLAMNLDMERQIEEIRAVCDYVQGVLKSPKQLWLSFDEWNVWYRARDEESENGHRTLAPHLLEEVYNLEDAILVGGFLNTLMRQSDRVRVACLAQLVNVIAPIVTNETSVLKQSTFYPYAWALKYGHGQVLDLRVDSETYPIEADGLRADFAINADVPYLDVVATLDRSSGRASVFMMNRDLESERELVLEWDGLTPSRVLACETLTGPDLKAHNTFANPNRVAPQSLDAPSPSGKMTFKLPARSYSVAQIAVS